MVADIVNNPKRLVPQVLHVHDVLLKEAARRHSSEHVPERHHLLAESLHLALQSRRHAVVVSGHVLVAGLKVTQHRLNNRLEALVNVIALPQRFIQQIPEQQTGAAIADVMVSAVVGPETPPQVIPHVTLLADLNRRQRPSCGFHNEHNQLELNDFVKLPLCRRIKQLVVQPENSRRVLTTELFRQARNLAKQEEHAVEELHPRPLSTRTNALHRQLPRMLPQTPPQHMFQNLQLPRMINVNVVVRPTGRRPVRHSSREQRLVVVVVGAVERVVVDLTLALGELGGGVVDDLHGDHLAKVQGSGNVVLFDLGEG